MALCVRAPTITSMTKAFRLIASTGIHKGDREYQQDQVALISHDRHNGCVLGVIADGMGGRSGGRKASDQVMMTARQLFERYSPDVVGPEAGIDPGAEIIDPAEGDLAFDEHYRAWLKDHLSGEFDDDIVARDYNRQIRKAHKAGVKLVFASDAAYAKALAKVK